MISLSGNENVKAILVERGAQLIISSNFNLTVTGSVTINGTAEIQNGNITLVNPAPFTLGPQSLLLWDPENNNAAGATLFINGIEDFHPESHLIIKKWYSYSQVPLGKVITGNFGHLTLSSLDNGLLFEWDQDNYFEEHRIIGTLTIDQGWIVLDKSGSITDTEIGAIQLSNINSYLDIHQGEHTGTIKLTTAGITNIGGTFNGLVNGNGHVDLTVTGDFINLGKSTLILNNGIQGTGNGNVFLKVNGKFRQTLGDFRGIFNITSKSSGTVNMEFGKMEVHGGIFMAQYNCHVSGGVSKIRVNSDLDVQLNHANNIFRGIGLTTLAGTASNAQLELTVAGHVFINGNLSAEVTTSASSGREIFRAEGNMDISGCKTSFNFGNHQTEIYITGNLTLSNAELNLSKTKGTLLCDIGKNFYSVNGSMNIKSGTGHGNLNIRGNYFQNGGKTYVYNNITEASEHIVYVTVSGDFAMDGGEFIFNNMPASATAHQLSLNGKMFSLINNAALTQSVNITNAVYGVIHFDRTGTISYSNSSQTASISNLKVSISDGCHVQVLTGNFISPAASVHGTNMVTVTSGGVLDPGNYSIYNNKSQSFSKLLVKDGGRIRISHPEGLYNGSAAAAINGNNNLDYELEPASIVEYYGEENQLVTGNGSGLAQSAVHEYGILEINKQNSKATPASGQISIRTTLFLNNGEFDLNGYNITIHNGRTHGITRENGYIRSEHQSDHTKGAVKWKNIEPGQHTIPFGTGDQEILPLSLNIRSGAGRTITASTKSSGKNNRPLPAGISVLPENGSGDEIIDRWFYINATGITADISLPYLFSENSTPAEIAEENFSATVWSGSEWTPVGGTGSGKITEHGAVESKSVQQWGHFLLISNKTGSETNQPVIPNGNSSNISAGSVYPIPFDQEFIAEFSMQNAKPVTITLMQVNGKVISRIPADGAQGTNKVTIKTDSTLPNGIYILDITDGISSIQNKIIRYK